MNLNPDDYQSREEFWLSVSRFLDSGESLEMFVRDKVLGTKIRNGQLSLLYGSAEDSKRRFWLKVNPKDIRSAAMTALCYGSYEPMVEKIFTRAIGEASFFLDAGANSGFYSLLARVTNPQAKVIAIEPNPEVAMVLFDNLNSNNQSDYVDILNCAIFDKRGSEKLIVPNFSGSAAGSMSRLHPEEKVESIFQIETILIDDVASNLPQLDLIKMDIEGAEFQALQGAEQTLTRLQPVIIVELLRKWMKYFSANPQDVFIYLSSLGYQCFAIGRQSLYRITEMNDNIEATNFLFLPSKHVASRYLEELTDIST